MTFQELLGNILGIGIAAVICDSMADRLVVLGRDLRHIDHCDHPESCRSCRANKQAIKENVPQWAQDVAGELEKHPGIQFRAVMESWSGREIAEKLGMTVNTEDE